MYRGKGRRGPRWVKRELLIIADYSRLLQTVKVQFEIVKFVARFFFFFFLVPFFVAVILDVVVVAWCLFVCPFVDWLVCLVFMCTACEIKWNMNFSKQATCAGCSTLVLIKWLNIIQGSPHTHCRKY